MIKILSLALIVSAGVAAAQVAPERGIATTTPATTAYTPQDPLAPAPPRWIGAPVPQSTLGDEVVPVQPRITSLPADNAQVIERFSAAPRHYTQTSGEALYRSTCEGCHMAKGQGAEGAGHYPPLAGNPKLVSKYYIVTVLLNGYHGMPRFGDQMNDAEVAAVTNFVRQALGGNHFDGTVTDEDVKELRGRQ